MHIGVIFDMDGVLVDSGPAHFESWQKLANQLGAPPITTEMFNASFGQRSEEIITTWFGPRTPDEINRLNQKKESLYREIISASFPAMPGAVDSIRRLHAAGFRIAVGSSGPPENVDLVSDRLGMNSYLSATVTGADVQRGKPDPQVFTMAARRLDLPASRCVVIEDAPVGIEAAHRAEMRCIALVGSHPAAKLAAADLTIHTLADLTVESIRSLVG